MTREQGALLELLDEVRDAGKRLKMRCYLMGDMLLYAVRDGVMHGYMAEVAMTRAGFEKFKRDAEARHGDDREFEEIGGADDTPALYYRYVNKNTLLYPLDYADVWKKFGIGVHIFILTRDDPTLTEEKDLRELPKTVTDTLRKNSWRNKEDGLPLLFSGKGILTRLPEDFEEEPAECVLNGHRYQTICHAEEYLVSLYGKKWRTCAVNTPLENYMVFTNPAVPYEEFLKDQRMEELDGAFFEKRRRFLNGYTGTFQEYDKAEKNMWNYLFAAEARIRCWKKYMPLKKSILEIWNSGRHDYAVLRMKTYLDLLAEYQKKGIALCFDPELWSIYLEWLDENGRGVERVKLEKMVWPEHLEPIDTPETRAWLEKRGVPYEPEPIENQ